MFVDHRAVSPTIPRSHVVAYGTQFFSRLEGQRELALSLPP